MRGEELQGDGERSKLSERLFKPMLLGFAMATLGLALYGRINEQQFMASSFTLCLAYAVVTTFRRLWSKAVFWLVIGTLGVLHAGLLRHLLLTGFQFSLYPSVAIGVSEGALAVLVLIAIFGPGAVGKGSAKK